MLLMYSFIKNKIPLQIKRKIVLGFRAVSFFILSTIRRVKHVLLWQGRSWRSLISSFFEKKQGFCLATTRPQKKKISLQDVGVGLDVSSQLLEETLEVVVSPERKEFVAVERPVKGRAQKRIGLLGGRLDALDLSVDLLSLVDISRSDTLFLVFVDSGAARKSYSDLVEVLYDEHSHILFKVKNDYSDFFKFLNDSNLQIESFSERVFYLSTIDADIDDTVYGIADEYSDFLVKELSSRFSNSTSLSCLADYLVFLRVTISDRLVGWVRSVIFLERFIRSRNISRFYMYGGGGIDGNILAFCVPAEGSSVFNVNAASKLLRGDLRSFVSRHWQPASRSIVTRYEMSDAYEDSSDIILFVGNLKDPQYKETNEPIISALAGRAEKKIVVISSHAHQSESLENCHFVSPSLESDRFHAIDELNSLIDDVVDSFVLSGLDEGEREGLLRLYVAMNSRRSLQRLLRDCLDLKDQVDKVCSRSRVSAIASCPGRLWASQFLVGYLGPEVPSFEVQSGTLSMTSRYKRPNSKYILSVDDFSTRVYVDFLGVERVNVEVVGAPRIDSKLSYIRRYTQAESKTLIFGGGVEDKIICVATQPYGVEVMSSMVEVVADFVSKNLGWYLLISMHPNENSMYESSYRALLSSRLPQSRFSMSKGNIYHNLNASSKVVTYFSTSGLEAFCLDKDVFTYRPSSGAAVPFDLADLGVAFPFTSVDDFSSLMDRVRIEENMSEGLLRLKDGASIERICSAVLRAAQ